MQNNNNFIPDSESEGEESNLLKIKRDNHHQKTETSAMQKEDTNSKNRERYDRVDEINKGFIINNNEVSSIMAMSGILSPTSASQLSQASKQGLGR